MPLENSGYSRATSYVFIKKINGISTTYTYSLTGSTGGNIPISLSQLLSIPISDYIIRVNNVKQYVYDLFNHVYVSSNLDYRLLTNCCTPPINTQKSFYGMYLYDCQLIDDGNGNPLSGTTGILHNGYSRAYGIIITISIQKITSERYQYNFYDPAFTHSIYNAHSPYDLTMNHILMMNSGDYINLFFDFINYLSSLTELTGFDFARDIGYDRELNIVDNGTCPISYEFTQAYIDACEKMDIIAPTTTALSPTTTVYNPTTTAYIPTTNYQTAGTFGSYLYRSIDSGTTWNQTGIVGNWLGVSISSTGQYQTAVNNGNFIYRSADYGITWNPVGISANWYDVSMSSSGQYQTALVDWVGIYRSTDYGQTWNLATSISSYLRFISVSSSGQYQVAASSVGKAYVSSDYGQTWSNTLNVGSEFINGCGNSGNGQYALVVQSVTYTNDIYQSADYGQTWNIIGPKGDWRTASLSEDGQYQIVGNINAQSILSNDYGVTWTNLPFSAIEVSMSSSGKYITAVKDNGSIHISSNYGVTWTNIPLSKYWFSVSVSDGV